MNGDWRSDLKRWLEPFMAAMTAGITDRLWSLDDVIAQIDADAPAPKPRGPYKKRAASI